MHWVSATYPPTYLPTYLVHLAMCLSPSACSLCSSLVSPLPVGPLARSSDWPVYRGAPVFRILPKFLLHNLIWVLPSPAQPSPELTGRCEVISWWMGTYAFIISYED